MHRANLLEKLERYKPIYPAEIEAKRLIITFVSNNTNCFDRSLISGHITASAWLLNYDYSKVLLTHHAKLNEWLQLGGHCDGNPDVLAVAIKEAQEESGIIRIEPLSVDIFDLDVHLIPAYKNEPEHYHYDIRFLLQVTQNIPFIISEESKDLGWFDKNPNSWPTKDWSLLRILKKWQQITF